MISPPDNHKGLPPDYSKANAVSPLRFGIDDPKQQARDLKAAGKSIFEIASALHIHPRQARDLLKSR